jgi:hypothetical protein
MGVTEQTLGQPLEPPGMIHLALEDPRERRNRRRLAQGRGRHSDMKGVFDGRQ